ncbi:MAG TPA: tRNA (guanosine(46)-N7)-methyltransferase TrmB, partial [Candidatus Sumerlaeota bacterium]|nr:tRNA (guanosine(46)-N7)-methyltransferase TrmB [Candidatus Sumerlaeota bacterium]
KKRHHKRRLFQPRLLEAIRKSLKPGGTLHIKTDVSEYYTVIVRLFESADFLEKLADQRLDEQPLEDDIVTNFQRKALEKGHPIHRLLYRRRA